MCNLREPERRAIINLVERESIRAVSEQPNEIRATTVVIVCVKVNRVNGGPVNRRTNWHFET